MAEITESVSPYEQLVHSSDRDHPANLICELCRKFYTLGWVRLWSFLFLNFIKADTHLSLPKAFA